MAHFQAKNIKSLGELLTLARIWWSFRELRKAGRHE